MSLMPVPHLSNRSNQRLIHNISQCSNNVSHTSIVSVSSFSQAVQRCTGHNAGSIVLFNIWLASILHTDGGWRVADARLVPHFIPNSVVACNHQLDKLQETSLHIFLNGCAPVNPVQLHWRQETHPIWTPSPCHNHLSPLLTCVEDTVILCLSFFFSSFISLGLGDVGTYRSSKPFGDPVSLKDLCRGRVACWCLSWCATMTTAHLDCSAFPNYVVMEMSVKMCFEGHF